jgi:pimeloyl-ACP methyl ester carboxylesterase
MTPSIGWMLRCLCMCTLLLSGSIAMAQTATSEQEPLGVGLEGFAYAYPVQYVTLRLEGLDARLAFMDVEPTGTPNGRTVVLMHGRNFFGQYWKDTIHFLSAKGYRVLAPDQIGFGKSTKPDMPHSLHLHAHNTKLLLDFLNIKKAIIVGHSLGGMMAARFALMYPETVDRLVLEDPLGLEDYRLKVPYATPDELRQEARKQNAAAIEAMFKAYFVEWKLEYQIYADVQMRWMLSPEVEIIVRTAAQTYAMAYEQPVVYELPQIKAPTLIVVGDKDRTALGRNRVSPEVRNTLGLMPELAKKAAASMPDAKVAVIADAGHIPHLEQPQRFYDELSKFIDAKR